VAVVILHVYKMSLFFHILMATERKRSCSLFLFHIQMHKPQTQNPKTAETSLTKLIQEDEYLYLLRLWNRFYVFRYYSFISFYLYYT